MQYNEMSKEQLLQLKAELDERYKEAKAKGLNLNMSRGKQIGRASCRERV